MKRISLITIHVGSNFGSVLQTIATSEFLLNFCDEVFVINYRPSRVTFSRHLKWMFKKPRNFFHGIVLLPNYFINRYIYAHYLKQYVKLGKPCYSLSDIRKRTPESELYVVGSDQVWNSVHNEGLDAAYYLPFVPKNKLISFSSSFGREKLTDKEYKEVKKYLNNFSRISVRESTARYIINSMGIEATHLLDPTFLLTSSEWKRYMTKERIVKDKYLLVYLPYNIQKRDEILETINLIATRKKLQTVSFSWDYRKNIFAEITKYYQSPGDFLNLMYYADFVLTNSFHGTAFSVNFNKQFYVFNPSGFSTRIESLLDLTQLTCRRLDEVITNDQIEDNIDFSHANFILNRERKKALIYLKQ